MTRAKIHEHWNLMLPYHQQQARTAAKTYRHRQSHQEHPFGEFDKAGRWWPRYEEQESCCREVRKPTRAWPYSYLRHCRSLQHIAKAYSVEPWMVRHALWLYPTD